MAATFNNKLPYWTFFYYLIKIITLRMFLETNEIVATTIVDTNDMFVSSQE